MNMKRVDISNTQFIDIKSLDLKVEGLIHASRCEEIHVENMVMNGSEVY
jgi:hypothetical protein